RRPPGAGHRDGRDGGEGEAGPGGGAGRRRGAHRRRGAAHGSRGRDAGDPGRRGAGGAGGAMSTTRTHPTDALLGVYKKPDTLFVAGEGSWLIAEDGKRYLDFTAGIGVNA